MTSSADRPPTEILEQGLDAAFLATPDGTVLYANPAACALFGYSLDELRRLGRPAILDEQDPQLSAALARRQQTGRFVGVLTGIRKDGSRFPAEVSSAIFIDANGNARTSTFIRDITIRERREEALRSAIEALNRALAELGELRGILPICSYCKSIRNDENYWQKVEAYFSSHSSVEFSHGICPDCYDEHVKPQLPRE